MKPISIVKLLSESLGLFMRFPKLILFATLSMFFTLLILILGVVLTFKFTDDLASWMCQEVGSETWGAVVEFLVYGTVSIGVAFFIYFFFVAIASIVSIPFMDLLSAEIELNVASSSEAAPFWIGLRRGILSTSIMMIRMLLIMFISLPLLFVPLVGSVLYFLINAWYMAYGYLDYPMGRKGWHFSDKKRFMKHHKKEQLFLGCFIYAMSLVPLLNLFIIPWATAASTLLFIRIEVHHQVVKEKSRKSIENGNCERLNSKTDKF